MAKFKYWDEELQREIRDHFAHDENGILYHKTHSIHKGKFAPGDIVKTHVGSQRGHLSIWLYLGNGVKYKLYVHRVVWFLEHGYQVAIIDHIDQNVLNNAPRNLREATNQENKRNQGKIKNVGGRYKGAYRASSAMKSKPWLCKVRIDGKTKHFGYFATEEEAARKYDEVAKTLYGEFAVLNFPE